MARHRSYSIEFKSTSRGAVHDQSEELDTIAAVDGQLISHVVRSTIAEHIEERKRDAALEDTLRQRIERARRMLPDDKQVSGRCPERARPATAARHCPRLDRRPLGCLLDLVIGIGDRVAVRGWASSRS